MQPIDDQKIYRLIDANYNRAKEAFRVCEDVSRFYFDNAEWTRSYKDCRHDLTSAITQLNTADLIRSRAIDEDVGRTSSESEMKRSDMRDIFYANSQRIKESVRVLEECSKLFEPEVANQVKQLRYKVYALEKAVISSF